MRIIPSSALVLTLSMALGPVTPAGGQQPALATLLAEADSANPDIAGARRTAEAAWARVPQAGALPDPTVGVGLMNVPVTQPGLGNDMMTMAQLRVGIGLPWPGKRGLREDAARLHAEAADWEVERVRQRVRSDVHAAYYEVYLLDRARDVTRRNEQILGQLARLTASRHGVGAATQPAVLRAQVERTSLLGQLVLLEQQRTSATARLNILLGRPSGAPVEGAELPQAVREAALSREVAGARFAAALAGLQLGEPPGGSIPPIEELQALALEHSPMTQAHVRRVRAQALAVDLAQTAKLPDLSLSAGYSRRSGIADFFDVMVSAPVPVFSGRKQSQAVVEQAAVLGEHEARHAAMVNDLDAEIVSLATALQRARSQLALLEDGVLPQARTGLRSATAAYQVGRLDLLELLDAQVTLYGHELEYDRLLSDFATTLAALERAVGTEVLP